MKLNNRPPYGYKKNSIIDFFSFRLPRININFESLDFRKVWLSIMGIIIASGIFYFCYTANNIADAIIAERQTIRFEYEQDLIPLKAQIELLHDEVSFLKSHMQTLVIYEYKSKFRNYQIRSKRYE